MDYKFLRGNRGGLYRVQHNQSGTSTFCDRLLSLLKIRSILKSEPHLALDCTGESMTAVTRTTTFRIQLKGNPLSATLKIYPG